MIVDSGAGDGFDYVGYLDDLIALQQGHIKIFQIAQVALFLVGAIILGISFLIMSGSETAITKIGGARKPWTRSDGPSLNR
ncbi:MAG: hypothetical protein QNJ97_16490 [Myxococcota bacterium]|nr:hypothetical protein [Myxococcota bacterium]